MSSSSRFFFSILLYLSDFEGHDYTYHLAVQEAASLSGLNAYCLIPKDCGISPLPKKWEKTFRRAKYRCLFPLLRLLDFKKIFKKQLSKSCIFFIESIQTKDLAIFTLAALLFMSKKDHLWLLLRYNVELLRQQGRIHRFLCWALKKKLKKNISLLTESPLTALSFQEKWKQKFVVVPLPYGPCQKPILSEYSEKKLRCWWPGEPRESKGLKEIQQLFATQDPLAAGVELIIHEKMTLLHQKSSLKYHQIAGNLPRAVYEEWLYRSDVLLLPYNPKTYQTTTSGIFIEAICAGKIALVKEGSWLAYELKKFDLESLIVDWENPLFFSHLFALVKDMTIKAKLQKMQSAYQNYHCVENFSKKIEELLDFDSSAEASAKCVHTYTRNKP